MAKSPIVGLVGLVMMAASILMLLFIILAGATNVTPFNKTYFLQADTKGISGALDTSQWTYFYICGPNNKDCSKPKPAYPFGYAWDSNAKNIPERFQGSKGGHTTDTSTYYLWRFGWVFLIMALFFNTLTFFSSFIACCGRLGAAISYFIGIFGLVFHTAAVAVIQATFVRGRDGFKDAGRHAKLGDYGFGFLWGSWAALVIATVLFGVGKKKDGSGSFLTRRGNFEGRRVKDDYS